MLLSDVVHKDITQLLQVRCNRAILPCGLDYPACGTYDNSLKLVAPAMAVPASIAGSLCICICVVLFKSLPIGASRK